MHVNEHAIRQLRVAVLLELASGQLECFLTVASTFIFKNISIDNAGCPSLSHTHYLLLPRAL